MDLLGVGGILFWLGIAMSAVGVRLAWAMVARHGGLDRTQTLHVIFDDESPMKRPEHRGDRVRFRAGVILAALGLVNLFTGVTTGAEREQAVCGRTCRRQGHWGGRFAPSAKERIPGTDLPQRACWCVGPAGSIELPPLGLPPSPSSPTP